MERARRAIGVEDFEAAGRIYGALAKRSPVDKEARAGVELCEGFRALATGDRMEAAQRFEAVLDLDPSNAPAAQELAKMRRQATNDRRGALSRLLNRMGGP
jgi:thioredoxin-like negative regulator of GroEL